MKRLFTLAIVLLTGLSAQAICTAGFTGTVTNNNVLTITNTSTYSGYAPNAGANYYITWGDGTPNYYGGLGSSSMLSHTYANPGSYTVSMSQTIYDSLANPLTVCTSSYQQTYIVTANPCSFTVSSSGSGLTKTFTATNPGNLPASSFQWNFGDGTSGTGNPVSHTYQFGDYYNVVTTLSGCAASVYTNAAVVGPVNCDSVWVFFYHDGYGSLVAYSEAGAPNNGDTVKFDWNFGNGSSATNASPYQTPGYTPGTYTVSVTAKYYSAGNSNTPYCQKTYTQSITVAPPLPATIAGYISKDSSSTVDTFKVWLIKHDAVTNTLSAVDSMITTGYGAAFYQFNSVPTGSYRTKGAWINGPASGPGFIPTYHTTSLYWLTATVINHGTAHSLNKHIVLQTGMMTSGPGFIGGSVAMGANKGTSGGVAGVNVLLRNANAQVIQHSTTDDNGQYEFSNIPVGTYTIYPEVTGYHTDPITVTITANATSSIENSFLISENAMTVAPGSLGLFNAIPRAAQLQLYPNPTTGRLNVSWKAGPEENVSIRIMNSMGSEVYNRFVPQGISQTQIELGSLPRGTYWLRFSSNTAVETKPLVVD